ncbi:hypothetical protein KCU77_g261, partial [Aureobasidium melanogenum]
MCHSTEAVADGSNSSVRFYDVLRNYELVQLILSYFRNDPKALSTHMRVSPVFFAAGARILWASAKPENLLSVENAQRRSDFASSIEILRLWSFEEALGIQSIVHPAVWRPKRLDVCGSSTHALGNQQLAPYLVSTLKDLAIWSDPGATVPSDNDWLAHISTSCRELTTLAFSIGLNVSDLQLSHFFSPLIHLKSLHVGSNTSAALGEAALSAIFCLPELEALVLVHSISHDFITHLNDHVEASMILPNIIRLTVTFLDGDISAPGELLRSLTTLRSLTLIFENTPERATALHSATFASIGTLNNLTTLSFSLGPNLDLNDGDIAALQPLHNLTQFNIWTRHGSMHQEINALHVSDQLLHKALAVLELITYIDLDLEWKGVPASYEDALILHHNIRTFSRGRAYACHVTVPEETSSEWPTADDYASEAASRDGIWKASLKSFPPDPIPWMARDLN